jgi:hypothetical protein
MSEQVKDIALDANEGIEAQIAKALKPYKDQLAAKDAQLAQTHKVATDNFAAARKAQSELAQTAAYANRTEHSAITNALAEADARSTSLQSALATAIETADGKNAAALQTQIAEIAARKLMLQQGKDQIEHEIAATEQKAQAEAERQKRQPAPQPQRQQSADPFEAAIAGLPESQRAWLRQHKDKGYVRPGQAEVVSPKLMKAYYDAKEAGLDEKAPAFVAHLDRVLGHDGEQVEDAAQRFAEPEPKPQRTQQQPQARRAMPAAPVTRSAGGGGAGGGREHRLTPAQSQTAQRLGMSTSEYVDGIKAMIQRGKLPASALQ